MSGPVLLMNRAREMAPGFRAIPGNPMRLDYGYGKNRTRGFLRTLSVSRAPSDWTLFAYRAEGIAGLFQSEFTPLTDSELQPDHNGRHRLVRDTLRDAGIRSLDMSAFAAWVPELKAQMHGPVAEIMRSADQSWIWRQREKRLRCRNGKTKAPEDSASFHFLPRKAEY